MEAQVWTLIAVLSSAVFGHFYLMYRQGTRIGLLEGRMEALEKLQGVILKRLDNIEELLSAMTQRLDGVEQRLDGVEQRLDGVERTQGEIQSAVADNRDAIGQHARQHA